MKGFPGQINEIFTQMNPYHMYALLQIRIAQLAEFLTVRDSLVLSLYIADSNPPMYIIFIYIYFFSFSYLI